MISKLSFNAMVSKLRPLQQCFYLHTRIPRYSNITTPAKIARNEVFSQSQLCKATRDRFYACSRTLVNNASTPEKTENIGEVTVQSEDTFASLLRHSAFVQIGNPVGKVSTISIQNLINALFGSNTSR